MSDQSALRWGRVIAVTVLGVGVLLSAGSVRAEDPEHMKKLLGSMQCPGCNLLDADLRGVNLRGAKLRNARLVDADLRGTDLRGANLNGADLFRANLQGADLRGADLKGAYLRGATWIDGQKCLDISCSKRRFNPF